MLVLHILQVFGWWKRRFHVLHSEIRMKPKKASMLVGACAVLHNIAISMKEPMDEEQNGEFEEGRILTTYDGPEDGKTIRTFITNRFFSE